MDSDLLLAGNDHFPNEVYFEPKLAQVLGDRKLWVPKVVNIIRAMPNVAVAASYDELAALPDKRFQDPREENLLYRLKYSAAPDRAGEILFRIRAHDPPWRTTGSRSGPARNSI